MFSTKSYSIEEKFIEQMLGDLNDYEKDDLREMICNFMPFWAFSIRKESEKEKIIGFMFSSFLIWLNGVVVRPDINFLRNFSFDQIIYKFDKEFFMVCLYEKL